MAGFGVFLLRAGVGNGGGADVVAVALSSPSIPDSRCPRSAPEELLDKDFAAVVVFHCSALHLHPWPAWTGLGATWDNGRWNEMGLKVFFQPKPLWDSISTSLWCLILLSLCLYLHSRILSVFTQTKPRSPWPRCFWCVDILSLLLLYDFPPLSFHAPSALSS